jgi:hypothetical protein
LQGAAQSQSDLQPQSDLQLQPLFEPQIGQAVAHGVGQAVAHGVAQGVAHGAEHGQAAITELIEHVAIPTAIAAATVSFLIVIFNLLVFLF